jgi:hypothetical protein
VKSEKVDVAYYAIISVVLSEYMDILALTAWINMVGA